MSNPTDLDQAAFQLQEAKNKLELVRQDVLTAEKRLIEIAGVKEEGTTSASGLYFKIKTVAKINRRIDLKELDLLNQTLPQAIISKAFVFKPSIDAKGLRHLELNEPEYYNEITRAVIATPAKISVSVELVEDAA
tara:strand:+ start:97 stop:501 length:405 start_codon:yes stop_codon:yes gene_type:complete